jgi:hypothetical protein
MEVMAVCAIGGLYRCHCGAAERRWMWGHFRNTTTGVCLHPTELWNASVISVGRHWSLVVRGSSYPPESWSLHANG